MTCVTGKISQLNITGAISQKGVTGSIAQKNVYGTIACSGGIPVPEPVVSTAVIANDAKGNVVLTFDLALDESSVPATSAFSVSDRTVSLVSVSGSTVTIGVTVDFTFGQTVTVGYTKPASNPLKSTLGGEVATFTDQAVTNNIETPLPVVSTAVIENAVPADLVLTFDIALDETSVPATSAFTVSDRTMSSVAISGAVVTLTVTVPFAFEQVVTVDYTKPGSNPLKSTVGGEVVSFANQAVTNNVESSFPSVITDNSPGWYIADELSTITKDGADRVSEWRDYLGSGNTLPQPLGADQPLWVLGDGVLFAGGEHFDPISFALEQPEFIYIVFKHITWTSLKRVFDGNGTNKGSLVQYGTTPDLILYAGGAIPSGNNDLALNTFGIARCLFNGAASKIQINANAALVYDVGLTDMDGFSLPGNTAFGNVQIKEVGIMPGDMGEAEIYSYLDTKYGPF